MMGSRGVSNIEAVSPTGKYSCPLFPVVPILNCTLDHPPNQCGHHPFGHHPERTGYINSDRSLYVHTEFEPIRTLIPEDVNPLW